MQALCKGLMYDAGGLDEALRIAPRLKREDAMELRRAVARDGLAARSAGVDVLATAKEAVGIAYEVLRRIAPEECCYLDVLRQSVVEDETCPADVLLKNWRGSWHCSINKVVEHLRIA
ncbi:MAG TPA: hypothetical protein VF507_03305, partial [Pyrinomonadaceae bacterium]|jgi:gamma-glutamylcysteine synthetase